MTIRRYTGVRHTAQVSKATRLPKEACESVRGGS